MTDYITEILPPPTNEQIQNYLECKAIQAAYKESLKDLAKAYKKDKDDGKDDEKKYKEDRKALKDKFVEDIEPYAF